MSTESLNPSRFSIESEADAKTLSLMRAFLESFKYHPLFFVLRKSSTSTDPVYPFAHQLELLAKLFVRKPVRVVIGDEIGLGKTITALMVIHYLIEAEGARRIIILVPRVLVQQWLSELKRFGFEGIIVLERDNISRYSYENFPNNIYLVSIDFAKREEHKEKILSVKWDVVVVDEAHRVGKRDGLETKRYELVRSLVEDPSTHVLLLTATPHRGSSEDYVERLKLVDPYLRDPELLDDEKFYSACIGATVFRRSKIDVNELYEKREVFKKCKFKARLIRASEEEINFHKELIEFLRTKLKQYFRAIGKRPAALPLLVTLIAKRASSSPRAAVITLDRIIQRRAESLLSRGGESDQLLDYEAKIVADSLLGYSFDESGLYEDEVGEKVDVDKVIEKFVEKCSVFLSRSDLERLRKIHDLAKKVLGSNDSRLASLINVVKEHLEKGDKVVVFTEFKDTAEYVFNMLKQGLPEKYAGKIALITSDGIEPPEAVHRWSSKFSIEDVKSWLRSGDVVLLVSTDVASEGLNLQVANVVIHYEPCWSPVKIVQRIGRVWRLGQERDVTVYSFLLSVDIDIAVFEVLYKKLLAWIITGVESQIPIGEELEIDMLPTDKPTYASTMLYLSSSKESQRYSEYEALIKYIKDGYDGLEKYVGEILKALGKLKKYAERFGLEKKLAMNIDALFKEGLGGFYSSGIEGSLRELLVSIAKLAGYSVEERDGKLYVRGTHFTGLKTLLDLYRAIDSLLKNVDERGFIALIVNRPEDRSFKNLKELYLYGITVYLMGRPVYSESAGVLVREGGSVKASGAGDYVEIRRGIDLLNLVTKLLNNVAGVCDSFWIHDEHAGKVDKVILDLYRGRVLSDFLKYIEITEDKYSFKHEKWFPSKDAFNKQEITTSIKLLGVLVISDGSYGSPPPHLVEEIERKAMEYAMKFEKVSGRVPEDVSGEEHYDIRSFDPKTGEVRFIEVKGRAGFDIVVELTEAEYSFGREMGDKYWLYVVYGLAMDKCSANPRLLVIRDPVNRAKWSVVEVKRYRLSGF